MKRFLLFAAGLLVAGSALAQATSTGSGQGYPSKPIKFLVPFTAGSGTDLIARSIADTMSKSMGQPIVIENKPGAGGTIAAGQVAKGEADGYTVLVHSSGHALNPAIYSTIGYDTLKDLTGITPLAALPNVLVVNPARGWKSVADLVAAAKAKPGQLNYASAGVGSATHLNAEKFRLQAGIEALHVPYKGTPEAMTNVIGGSNDWFFAPLASALPLVKDGKLQALAVSTPSRSPALPQVPTTVEAGVAGSDYTFWVGMIVASNTPATVVKRLHEEALKAMASPEVKERMNKLGAEPFPLSVEAFNAFIKTEVDAAARIAKAAGLKGQ
ncbi:MAG: tripartite tricarboxylate transporter substrate binding protein [Polaromonas sp.]|uniref:Bug family tripartite tricarboxylate transporter substrate binding protein n=1 Tax=Polaromonas sp. TaxID=1869339 RepID=UPI0027306610|nr:tripartite tricarboxylate transporter substrate binding protein [Polaromonas sp.]MDP2450567.1 tripartite tricarboxylate transporter substrate binding protein [Polaromonas sp.]MDP3250024.1 tripartite tricarboxylate transporter substrate binding protein [Polaromonas sp.]MDP3757329.1 tripartite tricarboxylate transporter substrate binding protein [Polaromonas sp.]